MTIKNVKFFLVNAFTSTTYGGNPAAVIFLDEPLPEDAYYKIAGNFNQPMAAFLLPAAGRVYEGKEKDDPFDPSTTKTFAMRWFTPTFEAPQCGHATLALAHELFQDRDLVPPTVTLLRFETMHCIFTARRISPLSATPKIQVQLPARSVTAIDEEEFQKIRNIVAKASGKQDIAIRFVGNVKGEIGFDAYVLVELDEQEDLGGIKFDTSAFLETPYIVNIMTKAGQTPEIAYETRMFAPKIGISEDHVCGSANCLLAPYWAQKLGKNGGEEMSAKQVSQRAGDLWTEVDMVNKKVLLSGEATTFAKGEFTIEVV